MGREGNKKLQEENIKRQRRRKGRQERETEVRKKKRRGEGQGIKISYFWEAAGNTHRVPESP